MNLMEIYAPAKHEWRDAKESFEARVGDTITLYEYNGKLKANDRVQATIVKPYDSFVLVEVKQRGHSFKESFLYADFFTGKQPRNGIAFDDEFE